MRRASAQLSTTYIRSTRVAVLSTGGTLRYFSVKAVRYFEGKVMVERREKSRNHHSGRKTAPQEPILYHIISIL